MKSINNNSKACKSYGFRPLFSGWVVFLWSWSARGFTSFIIQSQIQYRIKFIKKTFIPSFKICHYFSLSSQYLVCWIIFSQIYFTSLVLCSVLYSEMLMKESSGFSGKRHFSLITEQKKLEIINFKIDL